MANLEKIVEDLSSLTVLEAAELAKLLETKWGVSAAAAVAVLHLWKHNNLLSIFGGTVLYMVLVQAVF